MNVSRVLPVLLICFWAPLGMGVSETASQHRDGGERAFAAAEGTAKPMFRAVQPTPTPLLVEFSSTATHTPVHASGNGSEALPVFTPSELRALVKKIETQHRGQTSHGKTRMRIVTREWIRTLTMETWSEGRDRFLVRILEPAKERGTTTLKSHSDIWNYFPKIDRLIKIPSSLMGDKWMGSHFTNDDLVKEDKIDELYDLVLERAEAKSIVIRATPKPDAAVVWGRLEYTVDREKEVPLSVEYFDESGKKVRTMTFDQLESIGHRWVALRMRVQPCESTGESTELLFDSLEFDLALPPNLFSLQSLRKR